MRHPSCAGVRRAGAVIFALSLIIICFPATGAPQVPAGPAGEGRDLFVGRHQFANGGPACGACHTISAIGFPNGGLVGPDLSGAYQMLGPEGVDATLQTLFFPTMQPIYEKRPLTPEEQRALKAFLQQTGGSAGDLRDTPVIAGLAAGGFVVLMAAAWLRWRHRLGPVREELVLDTRSRG